MPENASISGDPILTLRGVTARYEGASGDAPLLDVSLEVRAGRHVCVLGPNGAGKTTLLRVASGVLAPAAGTVTLAGREMVDLDRVEIARLVAVVPQTEPMAFGFAVEEVVAMGRAPHQGAWLRVTEEDRAIVEDALARCDLTRLRARPVRELSGGEQKRVAIARAFAQRPRLLLLDEPAAMLDVAHQIALYDLVDEAVKGGLACVSVVHDLNIAAQYADEVLLLAAGGRVAGLGTVDEVMTYRKLREVLAADLYCGENDLTGARFFLPMRGRRDA
ncbi:MAG: ABC transporter ATP-binding protein [Myxococcales bacterium]|jgi:iron complex transport system ATP-binding protein|nr:ABC transporter ATP-binding protein [Myxococcales bacterium]